MKYKFTLLTAISVVLFSACLKSSDDGDITEDERALMTECDQNSLISQAEIENNLIGEWELVGFGYGGVGSNVPCPRISMLFSSDKVTTISDGEVSTSDWKIEEVQTANGTFCCYSLVLFPQLINNGFALDINTFCQQYMYADEYGRHGNMYLFEKVR